jgi:hypothetical protein
MLQNRKNKKFQENIDLLEKYKDMVIKSMGDEGYNNRLEYNKVLLENPHIADLEFGVGVVKQ